MVKQQRGHKARLELTDAQAAALDEQASAAITMWNCLHAYWTHFAGKRPTLAQADAAIRQARKDADFLAVLPAQAAQAVLKTYVQAWRTSSTPITRPKGRRLRRRRAARVWRSMCPRPASCGSCACRRNGASSPPAGRPGPLPMDQSPARHREELPGREGHRSAAGEGDRRLAHRVPHRATRAATRPAPGSEGGYGPGHHRAAGAVHRGETRHKPWLTTGERERLLRLERTAARRRAARTKASRSPTGWPAPTTRSPGSARKPSAEPMTGSTRPPPRWPGSIRRSWSKTCTS